MHDKLLASRTGHGISETTGAGLFPSNCLVVFLYLHSSHKYQELRQEWLPQCTARHPVDVWAPSAAVRPIHDVAQNTMLQNSVTILIDCLEIRRNGSADALRLPGCR